MPPENNNNQRINLIEKLSFQIHNNLENLLDGSPISILDFPDIRNCGDSAIWLGEIEYLKKYHGQTPAYTSTIDDFSTEDLKDAAPEGPIFIHGGGNFGDIWEVHQQFRERILEAYPDRPIIQFPQSIHFNSQERLEKTARFIEKHRNFTLLVRDEESKEIADRSFQCETRLCPDMAFCIGNIQRPSNPTLDVLAMLREDAEKSGNINLTDYAHLPVEDWITENKRKVRIAKLLGALSEFPSTNRHAYKFGKLNGAAQQRFGRGTKQISRAKAIVTDRLHVHIVSILLGIPHAVLDNSYGKVRRFMRAFSGDSGISYLPASFDEGVEWAQQQAAASNI